jgi:AraC-like DNA-binding protein
MYSVDFSKLTSVDFALKVLGESYEAVEGAYLPEHGVRLRSTQKAGSYQQDIVRINDGALVFAGTDRASCGLRSNELQRYCESDWVHAQFLLEGRVDHEFGGASPLAAGKRTCLVARHPANSEIRRTLYNDPNWSVLCLQLRPDAISTLLDVSEDRLPDEIEWMIGGMERPFEYRMIQLNSRMAHAIADMINCPYGGATRFSFMRAKSIELLTALVYSLQTTVPAQSNSRISLTERDRSNIALIRDIINKEMQSNLSLDTLARKVGVNRSKLAFGFKELYGCSVWEYLSEVRLEHARMLLIDERASVTEAAQQVGYSHSSSFTRAFVRHYGISPKECRRQ